MFGLIIDGSSQVYLSQAKAYTDLIVFSFLYGMADGVVFGTFYICILNSVEASRKARSPIMRLVTSSSYLQLKASKNIIWAEDTNPKHHKERKL